MSALRRYHSAPCLSSFVEWWEDEPPAHLLCPITHCLLRDPVINAAGNTYEREALTDFWKLRPRVDPLSSVLLCDATLIPNAFARQAVDAWLEAHCDAGYTPDGWPCRELPPLHPKARWPLLDGFRARRAPRWVRPSLCQPGTRRSSDSRPALFRCR